MSLSAMSTFKIVQNQPCDLGLKIQFKIGFMIQNLGLEGGL